MMKMVHVSWLLLLPLPVYSFSVVFGPVYQRARSHFRKPIFISSDVQDGRSRCSDIDKVIGRIDGFACDTLSLPDIKVIAETDQRNMITMCFGLYDLLFEMCKRKDAGFADAFNVDLRESQKPSDFCLEVVTIQLSAIQHTDPVFDKWADYFNKTLLSKQSCEDLCKLQNSVHVICKLIVAGHRYLRRTLVVDAQDYNNLTQSQSLPTTNGTNNDTTVGTEPSSWSPDIRTTKNKDNLETTSLLPVSEVVSGMNKNSVGTEAGFIRMPEVRTTQKSTMSAVIDAPKNLASSLKDDQSTSGIYSSTSTEEDKKFENNSEDVSEESTTVQSVGKDKHGEGEGAGFAIWLAVSFILITILTAIIIFTVRKRVSNNRPEIEQALITM